MKRSKTSDNLAKFRRIEAWSMKMLGFSYREIAEELKNIKAPGAVYLIQAAMKNQEVPPNANWCEDIAPMYTRWLSEAELEAVL